MIDLAGTLVSEQLLREVTSAVYKFSSFRNGLPATKFVASNRFPLVGTASLSVHLADDFDPRSVLMTVLLDPSIVSDLEGCRARLAKNATFEKAIKEVRQLLQNNPTQFALPAVQARCSGTLYDFAKNAIHLLRVLEGWQ